MISRANIATAGTALKRLVAIAALVVSGSIMVLACRAQDQNDQNTRPPIPAPDRLPANKPLHESLTALASEELRLGQYERAITNADRCIDHFRAAADQIQSRLESDHKQIGVGAVSQADKELIAANAILNDVAACLFIKGQAAEKLALKEGAIRAYTAAKKYTYARTLDPKSRSYSSPADAAAKRLEALL